MKIWSATKEDAPAILAIYAPYCTESPVTFEVEAPTVEEIASRISNSHAWLVCEIGGVVAGYAYGSPHRARPAYRWSVEVSVFVGEEFQGRGIGRMLYEALFEALIGRGFCNAYAGIVQPNAASNRLHEVVGFRYIGVFHRVGFKLGEWHDVAWYEKQLQDLEVPPS